MIFIQNTCFIWTVEFYQQYCNNILSNLLYILLISVVVLYLIKGDARMGAFGSSYNRAGVYSINLIK